MIRNISQAIRDMQADPPTINEQFTSGSGVFTLSGGASVSSGRLNLLTSSDKAEVNVAAFPRGWYIEARVQMRDFDFSEVVLSVEDEENNGYGIAVYCDPFEDFGIAVLTKSPYDGEFDTLVSDGGNSYFPYTSYGIYRIDVLINGTIQFRKNGVLLGTVSNSTHTEFSKIRLRHVGGGGGYLDYFKMGVL